MSNLFGETVKFLIENNLMSSIKILTEDDKADIGDSDEESDDDIFDILDDSTGESDDSGGSDESESSESDSEESPEDADSEESVEEESETSESDNESVTKEQLKDLQDQIAKIADTIEGVMSDDGLESVESYISKAVTESRGVYRNYAKSSIQRFLFEEVEPEEIETDIDALDKVLTKGTDFVDKFKKGKDVNVSKYVDAAINAYSNFDSLFEKEKIVKQAAINLLVLNSGAKADANVKEFEEAFHSELSKKFGIDYEDFNVNSTSYKTGTGAVRQG